MLKIGQSLTLFVALAGFVASGIHAQHVDLLPAPGALVLVAAAVAIMLRPRALRAA